MDLIHRIHTTPRWVADAFQASLLKTLLWMLHRCGIPPIVCLCGSTQRALADFRQQNLQETLRGRIVLSIGCDSHSDTDLFGASPEEMVRIKEGLDWLHKRKIDIADEVYILNPDGYIGSSTQSEIVHARRRRKRIRWLVEAR